MKTIAIIGAGYVGLVTGACFAQKNVRVIVIENNEDKIKQLLNGDIPFYEPHLSTIVKDAIAHKMLTFEKSIAAGITHNPSIIFSCVGTPSLPNGAADLSFVKSAAHEIGKHIKNYVIVVNKSTVPVGTATIVKEIINHELTARNVHIEFDVASNPEFLKEGNAVNDFLYPDRVVIGVENERAELLLHDLYTPFITHPAQFICMNVPSAELTKYASNVMLALRISFMNQLAHLTEKVGADIEQIKNGMAKDKRIGPHFLNAGIGYGGSCFPKDVSALIHMGADHHFPMTLAQAIDNINHFQRTWFINRIHTHYGPALSHKTAGIWGLAFKPETDDIRCAPSIDVINDLLATGTKVIAYDPVATENIRSIYANTIAYAKTPQEVLNTADFLIILTECKEFLMIQPDQFTSLNDKIIFDGRNCFDPNSMSEAGITYACIGRKSTMHNNKYIPSSIHHKHQEESSI